MTFSDQPIVSVKNVHIMQSGRTIIRNLNFEIAKGEFVYLIGKTGSGKSSVLRTLYADLVPEQGDIRVVDYPVNSIARKEVPFLRRKIGIVFQDFQLFTDRSVAENLLFVMKATGWSDRAKMKKRLSFVLMQVGLDATQTKMPHQLSGGEQQRVAIARALINDPQIIFADEPTGNLDPTVANEILELFIRINQSGTAVLMATHNHVFLKRHPARVLYCENQQVKDIPKDQVSRRMSGG